MNILQYKVHDITFYMHILYMYCIQYYLFICTYPTCTVYSILKVAVILKASVVSLNDIESLHIIISTKTHQRLLKSLIDLLHHFSLFDKVVFIHGSFLHHFNSHINLTMPFASNDSLLNHTISKINTRVDSQS